MPVFLATQRQRSGDHGSKPAWANSLRDLILKKPIAKKGVVEWLKVWVLSSNQSAAKKKKR
jgi:hypothetical protein